MTGLFANVTATAQGIGGRAGKRKRRHMLPPPDDFADNARDMNALALSRRYGVSSRVIARWCSEANVTLAKYTPTPEQRAATSEAIRRYNASRARQASYAGPKSTFVARLPQDSSHEGRAADHLRRFAPLYRCTEHGRADPKGSHWSYGYSDPLILTAEEMVERARAKGWDADEWRRVA